jgi:type IV secretion system protein TrbL
MIGLLVLSCVVPCTEGVAFGQVQESGTVQGILDLFQNHAAAWVPTLRTYALRLFWVLASIEFIWTSMVLALEGADLKQFVAELVRRILFIGLFYAILLHGDDWARAIIESFRQAAGAASGGAGGSIGLSPDAVFSMGLRLAWNLSSGMSWWQPGSSAGLAISAIVIMICFALMAAFLALALVEMYVVINAGIILLGFGGSRWTSDYAMKFLTYAVAVGAKLFVMELIVGLCESVVLQWETNFAATQDNSQVLALIGISIVILALIKIIPDIIQGVISGVSFHASAGLVAAAGSVAAGTLGMVTGAAAGAGAVMKGATGAGMAVQEAAKLAGIQQGGQGTGFGTAVKTLGNLARAAKQDFSDRVTGRRMMLGNMGGRMAESLREASLSIGEGPSEQAKSPADSKAVDSSQNSGTIGSASYISPLTYAKKRKE